MIDRYKYDVKKLLEKDPESFINELKEYLLENGIPKKYFMDDADDEIMEPEMLEKYTGLIVKKYGPDSMIKWLKKMFNIIVAKLLLKENPIEDQGEFMDEIQEQLANMRNEEFAKALKKEDFVKCNLNIIYLQIIYVLSRCNWWHFALKK